MAKQKKFLTLKQGYKVIRAKQLASFRRYLSLNGSGSAVTDFLNMNAWELREYVESLWGEGMNWENYGEVWVVDHIIPLKFFDPTNFGEMEVCWCHYNLMPSFSADNHVKGCAPEVAVKMLQSLPDVPMVRVLLDKANVHAEEFERYYERD